MHVEFYGDVSIFQRQSCSSKGAHPPTTSGNLIYNALESHHVWCIYEIIKLHGPYIPYIDPYSKVEGPHRQEQISQQIYGKQINSDLCHLEEECGEVGWAIGGVGKKHLNFRWNSSCTVVIDFWKIIFLLNRVYLWIYIWGSMLIVGGYIIWFLSRVANWIELDCLDSVAFYASHYHLVGLLCFFLVFPHVTFLLQIPDGLPRVQW
jgi:hypothetical protein